MRAFAWVWRVHTCHWPAGQSGVAHFARCSNGTLTWEWRERRDTEGDQREKWNRNLRNTLCVTFELFWDQNQGGFTALHLPPDLSSLGYLGRIKLFVIKVLKGFSSHKYCCLHRNKKSEDKDPQSTPIGAERAGQIRETFKGILFKGHRRIICKTPNFYKVFITHYITKIEMCWKEFNNKSHKGFVLFDCFELLVLFSINLHLNLNAFLSVWMRRSQLKQPMHVKHTTTHS